MHLDTDVWREACRHIEIADAMDRIAPILGRSLPIELVLVRRIDLERSRLTTVAVGVCRPGLDAGTARTECTARAMQWLLEWCGQGLAQRDHTDTGSSLVKAVVPGGLEGSIVAGPLIADGRPAGVMLLVSREPLTAEHAELAQRLLEPLTVALENDRRFHEIARLREAMEADNRALLSRLDRQEISDAIVGQDSGLRGIMGRVEQVAPTDATVLILGETGSGKEVVARAIHARSRRAAGPIVRVNCGAIPSELIDSELFGHERGSFTGAVSTRKGWFERADGGTLFLDEVGELPLAAQVRLLRVLQDGMLDRVGGQRPIAVDVRVVAATHRNLEALVAAGQFREDLWYRINVFPMRLPPLRERPEDIPALAAHFAQRVGKRLGGAPLVPSRDDIAMLVAYPWPGNVRELASVIERAAILGNGRRLEIRAALGASAEPGRVAPAAAPMPEEMPPRAIGEHAMADDAITMDATLYHASLNAAVGRSAAGRFPSLDAVVAAHIERALRATRGRIEGPHGAAALLGINPHTLRARMRKLAIDWRRFRLA